MLGGETVGGARVVLSKVGVRGGVALLMRMWLKETIARETSCKKVAHTTNLIDGDLGGPPVLESDRVPPLLAREVRVPAHGERRHRVPPRREASHQRVGALLHLLGRC